MDQQTVDKVLAILREGASAATGAAKEGFTMICQHKSAEAFAQLASMVMAIILFASLLIYALRRFSNPRRVLVTKRLNWFQACGLRESSWGPGDDKGQTKVFQEEVTEDAEAWGVASVMSGILLAIALVLAFIAGPSIYADMRYPQGAVIRSIVNR